MFGFIIKSVIVLSIIAGILFIAGPKIKYLNSSGSFSISDLTNVSSISAHLKNIDVTGLSNQLSQSLDSLVTHKGNSPVVLGVQIADTSLDAVVNLIRNLPPDELNQIKSYVCQPATPSAK
jgi:hypothetical protein